MAEKVEDLNLPNSIVVRILKDSIPDSVNVSKDARTAFAKAATVFVLYTTSCANGIAMKANRKTLTVSDVYEALIEMDFENFIESMQKSLEAHHAEKGKKDSTSLIKPKRRKTSSETVKDLHIVNDIQQMDTNEVEENDAENELENESESEELALQDTESVMPVE